MYNKTSKKAEFDYSKPSYCRQLLYLSKDTTKLLELIIEKGQATVMKRDKTDEQLENDLDKTVVFAPYRRVTYYP
jgi:hypothetical protein